MPNTKNAIGYPNADGSFGEIANNNPKYDGINAADVSFDNTGTGMSATNVQGAIVEVNSNKQDKLALDSYAFNNNACLYKYGKVVTFVIRNITESALEGMIIPQRFRPIGVDDIVNFRLTTYGSGGQNPKPCYVGIFISTGAIGVDDVDTLITGTLTWMTP